MEAAMSAQRATTDEQLLSADPAGELSGEKLDGIGDIIDRAHVEAERAGILHEHAKRVISAAFGEVPCTVGCGGDHGGDRDPASADLLSEHANEVSRRQLARSVQTDPATDRRGSWMHTPRSSAAAASSSDGR
ncbi:MAG: hypothetical protein QOI21_2652 [Actinomycetota bacterium]|nr:hypothetical protein [Actinomycetota bacterium]